MATSIIMPKSGMLMEEGSIIKWLKSEGDKVEQGEPLLEIQTDKVSMEIEAPASGILLRILKGEGDTVPVTQVIGYIGTPGEIPEESTRLGEKMTSRASVPVCGTAAAPATPAETADKAPAGILTTASEIKSFPGKIAATPAARRLAKEKNIDLFEVKATGKYGEIRAGDVLSHKDVIIRPVRITIDGKEVAEETPYKGVRRIIGDRMAESKFTAPHVYFTQKVDAERLLDVRKKINTAQDCKTSVNDYILKAAVHALQKYPELNASLIDDKIIIYRNANIGFAVAVPGGLIVPVIRNADRMTVVEISNKTRALTEKARTGKLTPDDYTGGTFTVSNLGMLGIENFTAIINPPEAGILAVSAAKDEAAVVEDASGNKIVAIKPMMNITLTVDHRIVDGLTAAQFVTEIKRLLEHPMELILTN